MIRFIAYEPLEIIQALIHHSVDAAEIEGTKGSGAELTEDERNNLLRFCERVERFCEHADLQEAKNRLDLFKTLLGTFSIPYHYRSVCTELNGVQYAIESELGNRVCILLGKDGAAFFGENPLFGDVVQTAFPSCTNDIKSAGRCIALEFYTASVFHLMKAVEFGLRALARSLRIKKINSRIPLDFGTWEEIIVEIEKKIRQISSGARGPKKQANLDFYIGIINEMRHFKDYYRNSVSHARVEYDEHKARSAFIHVGEFMRRLAERVSEN